MKHMRILILVLALALLCAGCASGGTAEATPAPDMSDLPLNGGYAYLRVEVLSRDKDAKTLEVRVLDFGEWIITSADLGQQTFPLRLTSIENPEHFAERAGK